MKDFYAVLCDMGLHPNAYSVATIGEVRAFIDGYRFGRNRENQPSIEVPPFTQFSEWLVRKLGRGDTSLGWWQILHMDNCNEAAVIRNFAALISEFSQRHPVVVSIAKLDTYRHQPTGNFQFGFVSDGKYTDMSTARPQVAKIIHYASDEGVYLEYTYDITCYEHYCDSLESARDRAHNDFRIEETDWIGHAEALLHDRTMP
ncbi:hypothetical protein SH467x_002467 [Pirellulaceae bacterium SH467]